jgi:hypothetical protein
MLVHGVTLALVPWLLDSSELVYGRRSRPLPGQDRRGEPVRPRPVQRRPLTPAQLEARDAALARNAGRRSDTPVITEVEVEETDARPDVPTRT